MSNYFARLLRPAQIAPPVASAPVSSQSSGADIQEVDEVVALSSRGDRLGVDASFSQPGAGGQPVGEAPVQQSFQETLQGGVGEGSRAGFRDTLANPAHPMDRPGSSAPDQPPPDRLALSAGRDVGRGDIQPFQPLATPAQNRHEPDRASLPAAPSQTAAPEAGRESDSDRPASVSGTSPADASTGDEAATIESPPTPQVLLEQVLRWVATPAAPAVAPPATPLATPLAPPVPKARGIGPEALRPEPLSTPQSVFPRNLPPAAPPSGTNTAGTGPGGEGLHPNLEEDRVRISIGDIQVRVTPPATPPVRRIPAQAPAAPLTSSGLRRRCIHL